jgi:predicted flap endonuclease-1-like 5' DNA nuclease
MLRPQGPVYAQPAVAAPASAAPVTAAPVAAVPVVVPIELLSPEGEPATPGFTSIKGIGPALEQRLRASGVTSVAQVAAWSDEDIERLAPTLKVSPERIRREAWVEQARVITGDSQTLA